MTTTISNSIVTMISLLLSMAFFTLLEHKILGYSQHRKGPNKIHFMGLAQPLSDALKLLSKESSMITKSNKKIYVSGPILTLMIALTLWTLMPTKPQTLWFNFSLLLFIMISSCSVYPTIMMGWGSNSKYSLLGTMRSVAQTISYEISMVMIILSIIFLSMSWSLKKILLEGHSTSFMLGPIILMWITSILAETNRSPFDFAEGESELVSGFNTEYGSTTFIFIFMAEYLSIIFMSLISSLLILNYLYNSWTPTISFSFITFTISSLIIYSRSTYPRLRYDQLMNLTWLSFLPTSIFIMMMMFQM